MTNCKGLKLAHVKTAWVKVLKKMQCPRPRIKKCRRTVCSKIQVMHETSHGTRHTSHVTRHTSHVARRTSHVARYKPLRRSADAEQHCGRSNTERRAHVTYCTLHVTRHIALNASHVTACMTFKASVQVCARMMSHSRSTGC